MKWVGLMIATIALLGVACKAALPTQAPPLTNTPIVTAAVLPGSSILEVTSPEDESIVREPSVLVRGQTLADAVVSVNGQPAEVNADGSFTARVALVEGPNIIEIVASDFRGSQRAQVLSVIHIR